MPVPKIEIDMEVDDIDWTPDHDISIQTNHPMEGLSAMEILEEEEESNGLPLYEGEKENELPADVDQYRSTDDEDDEDVGQGEPTFYEQWNESSTNQWFGSNARLADWYRTNSITKLWDK